jgi:nucleotide-binding universal stress UspA family protein
VTSGPERPVLVGVADVAESDPALRYAAAEALRDQRPVQVVHVLTRATAPYAESLLEDAVARLRELTDGRVAVDSAAHPAPLVPALTTLSGGAALVVLQRRPRTRLQRLVEGSVSAHVAGQAHAPTVWVPEDWDGDDDTRQRIVVGVDAADDADSVDLLRHALVRAEERHAALSVVHGWQLSSGYDDAVVDQQAVASWEERYQRVLMRWLSVLEADHPDVRVDVQLVHLPPDEALVQASEDAALAVLGRGRLAHPLIGHLGSVTRAVMNAAVCPVEVIPDSGR